MLRLRDWSDIADEKVNRRDMEALRVAQDFQATGIVQTQDLRFEGDSTPAANKVDSQQIEKGNLMNVIKQSKQSHEVERSRNERNSNGYRFFIGRIRYSFEATTNQTTISGAPILNGRFNGLR
jgi:hypothetical protein